MGLSTGIKFIHNYGSDSDIEKPPPPTDIIFGNSAITNADGTRSVVSEGTDTTAKLDLYSGQGLRFDGTQFIDTDFSPDLAKDFTLLWSQERVDLNDRQNGSYANNRRFHFGINSLGIRCGVGDNANSLSITWEGVKAYSCFAKYNATSGLITFGLNGGARATFTTTQTTGILPLQIGAVNGLSLSVVGSQKDFYFIPKELTDADLASHLQNPEKTLYYDKGELKSDLLAQPIVDDIVAGNGFWYPLCENNSYGNLATDLSVSEAKTIVNYTNSPMRDNATKLSYGLQTSLIKQDSFGLPIGIADNSELVWVDESYATPDVPLVLTGNFCVDTYVKEIGTADSTFLNFTTDTVDPILIGVAGATGNVDIALLTEYTSTAINASGAVVSLERDGGTLKAFVNNVEVSRISYAGTVTLDILGASTTTSNFATGESGSLGFTKTTRTYGQRLSTYNALRAKHGV